MTRPEPISAAFVPQGRVYQIRISGHLSQAGMDWFEGLELTAEADGNTLISGLLSDQAALHGLLKKIRDLALPLLSVNCTDPVIAGIPAYPKP